MRIVATGGRDVNPTEDEMADFAHWIEAAGVTEVNHGGCPTGLDAFLQTWCHGRIAVRPHPVDHRLDGPWPGAGPRRNGRMLRSLDENGWPIQAVAAFRGGKGTRDCRTQAEGMGIPVRKIRG